VGCARQPWPLGTPLSSLFAVQNVQPVRQLRCISGEIVTYCITVTKRAHFACHHSLFNCNIIINHHEKFDPDGWFFHCAISHCGIGLHYGGNVTTQHKQDTVVYGRLSPGAATWRTGRNIRVVFDSGLFGPLYKNVTSSTKPRNTQPIALPSEEAEPRLQLACTKIRWNVDERFLGDTRADRRTEKRTDGHSFEIAATGRWSCQPSKHHVVGASCDTAWRRPPHSFDVASEVARRTVGGHRPYNFPVCTSLIRRHMKLSFYLARNQVWAKHLFNFTVLYLLYFLRGEIIIGVLLKC